MLGIVFSLDLFYITDYIILLIVFQGYCRFPKLEECAHFHYERVQLGQILLRLVEDKSDLQSSSNASQHDNTSQMAGSTNTGGSSTNWFIIKVSAERSDPFLIRRSFENLKMLDEMLHRCVYDRKISGLKDFKELEVSIFFLYLHFLFIFFITKLCVL